MKRWPAGGPLRKVGDEASEARRAQGPYRRPRVRDLGERRVLDRILPRLSSGLPSEVIVKPGDDAAVVRGGSADWVVTTDMLVEGIHFRHRWTSGADLGHKALAVNLSDLAAMGNVVPSFGVVSLGISPSTAVDFVDNFHHGMRRLADRHGLSIVGGDTVRADSTVVSITVVGKMARAARPVRRSGAKVGDTILVTGTLGDAATGLRVLEKKGPFRLTRPEKYLVKRFLRPEPRLALVRRLTAAGKLNSLIDSSDGFYRSVDQICRASRVGARVELDSLPTSRALRSWVGRPEAALDAALTGGEDYELVLTAVPSVARLVVSKGLATSVGQVVPFSQGVIVQRNGKRYRVPEEYEHFC